MTKALPAYSSSKPISNKTPMAGIAIYARKSTESEDRQILSIDSQIKELKEFAVRQGIAAKAVFTESQSAKAPGRPSLMICIQESKRARLME